jgi:hypothetical protein
LPEARVNVRIKVEVEVVTTAVEDMYFPLPRELRETA